MASLWDAIDDELYKLPPELKDPRFDSLRHVLNIVSSVNAESSVDEVSHPALCQASVLKPLAEWSAIHAPHWRAFEDAEKGTA